jgi:repressor LexA
MVKPLTDIQATTLEFIQDFVKDNGYPPTVRQVADRLGLASPSTAHLHIRALQKKGYISVVPGSPRAIRICEVP